MMLVYVVALAELLAYASAVPGCLTFRLRGPSDARFAAAVGLFAPRRPKAGRSDHRRGGGPDKAGLLRALMRLRFSRVRLRGELCLGDAAATALLWGVASGLGGALGGRARRLDLRLRPDFAGRDIRVALDGMIVAPAGQIMWAVFREKIRRAHPWRGIPLKT